MFLSHHSYKIQINTFTYLLYCSRTLCHRCQVDIQSHTVGDFCHRDPHIISVLLLFLIFSHFYVGSMCLIRLLHLARSCASSLDNSLSDKSFLILSNHLRFGLPLLLFPGTSIAITLI